LASNLLSTAVADTPPPRSRVRTLPFRSSSAAAGAAAAVVLTMVIARRDFSIFIGFAFLSRSHHRLHGKNADGRRLFPPDVRPVAAGAEPQAGGTQAPRRCAPIAPKPGPATRKVDGLARCFVTRPVVERVGSVAPGCRRARRAFPSMAMSPAMMQPEESMHPTMSANPSLRI
jgi:hypothetical protein